MIIFVLLLIWLTVFAVAPLFGPSGILVMIIVVVLLLLAVFALVKIVQFGVNMMEKEIIVGKQLREIELLIKFEDHVKAWSSGQISDDELKSLRTKLGIDITRLWEMIEDGESELTDAEIKLLKEVGIISGSMIQCFDRPHVYNST